VRTASIIRAIMEAVHISEPSVYSKEITWRYIPEGANLHTRHGENPKCQIIVIWLHVSNWDSVIITITEITSVNIVVLGCYHSDEGKMDH
jgi:hypothetical protein